MMHRLALGTVQMGLPYGIANTVGQVPAAQVCQMLRTARDAGLDTLDTAIAYGDSESRLGRAGVDGFCIVTKLPEVPLDVDVTSWVMAQIHGSLQRLGVQAVYAVLLHRPQQLKDARGQEIASALQLLKHQGLTQKTGVSIYGPEDLNGLNINSLDLVQAPYNLLDQRLFTSGWAQRLVDRGVEIHTRSVFLQGLLLMSVQDRPTQFDRWNGVWVQLADWLKSHRLNPLQACLGFALAQPSISKVVVGAETVDQFEQLLAVAQAATPATWPDLQCEDAALINPSNWCQR